MFVNFANVLQTSRKKPPFGIAQVGKSFRNEITPQNWIFRTREFEQMEMEFFVPPAESAQWYEYWCNERLDWYVDLGIPADMLQLRPHDADELSHYSVGHVATSSSCSRGAGTSSRASPSAPTTTSTQHAAPLAARSSTTSTRPRTSATCPYVIEPAAGATRTMAAFLLAAYDEDEVGGEAAHRAAPAPAPRAVQGGRAAAVEEGHAHAAGPRGLRARSAERYMVDYDETQAIGRRYRRQDEIGTPLCVTVDFDSLDDKAVTIRDRDTTEQVRVPIDELPPRSPTLGF